MAVWLNEKHPSIHSFALFIMGISKNLQGLSLPYFVMLKFYRT